MACDVVETRHSVCTEEVGRKSNTLNTENTIIRVISNCKCNVFWNSLQQEYYSVREKRRNLRCRWTFFLLNIYFPIEWEINLMNITLKSFNIFQSIIYLFSKFDNIITINVTKFDYHFWHRKAFIWVVKINSFYF